MSRSNRPPMHALTLAAELHQAGKLGRAEKEYQRYLAARPDDAEALMAFGVLRAQQGRWAAALSLLGKAAERMPASAPAHYNLGRALLEAGRPADAVAELEKALALEPNRGETLNNLGNALRLAGRYEEAISAYRRALASAPRLADAAFNLGLLLGKLLRRKEAIEALATAARLAPKDPKIHYELALWLFFDSRYDLAAKAYAEVLALDPAHRGALTRLTYLKRQTADWENLMQLEARCVEAASARLETNDPPASTYALAAITDDPAVILKAARAQARHFCRGITPAAIARRPVGGGSNGRIKVAYVSGDFREHATSYLTAGLFENHDRDRFELVAVSYGPAEDSSMRRRLEATFDTFLEARDLSPADTARLMREHSVDIAVDLVVFNQFTRMDIFAHRAAPIQVNYLGWPGTSGAPFMDYIIADPIVIPADQEEHYSEAVVRLPECYQPNDPHRRASDSTPTRSDCGLPESAIVFCSFNNIYKLSPATFDVWIGILADVPGSVLWMLDDNPVASANLRRAWAACGLAPERLVLAPRLPLPEHLARHRHADIFLDTQPYNAHTTASDALWMGVPVVTCSGRAFQSRVAASLVTAVGAPDLIATDMEAYRRLAVALARDPERLAALKQRLRTHGSASPLFDTARYTRHLEDAYTRMWENWQRGRMPAAIDVPACPQSRP